MSDKEILLACIISLCIIICIFGLLYFRRKIISTSVAVLNSHEQKDIFLHMVEDLKKQITDDYRVQMERTKGSLTEYYKEDAIRRSKSATKGKIAVQLAPFSVNGLLNPTEIVYLGNPIDMISFTNIETGEDVSLDFIKIKTGNAVLNKKQRLIRKAISDGRIYYRTVYI